MRDSNIFPRSRTIFKDADRSFDGQDEEKETFGTNLVQILNTIDRQRSVQSLVIVKIAGYKRGQW